MSNLKCVSAAIFQICGSGVNRFFKDFEEYEEKVAIYLFDGDNMRC